MKPRFTGLWQGHVAALREVYIRDWSLFADLLILARTAVDSRCVHERLRLMDFGILLTTVPVVRRRAAH